MARDQEYEPLGQNLLRYTKEPPKQSRTKGGKLDLSELLDRSIVSYVRDDQNSTLEQFTGNEKMDYLRGDNAGAGGKSLITYKIPGNENPNYGGIDLSRIAYSLDSNYNDGLYNDGLDLYGLIPRDYYSSRNHYSSSAPDAPATTPPPLSPRQLFLIPPLREVVEELLAEHHGEDVHLLDRTAVGPARHTVKELTYAVKGKIYRAFLKEFQLVTTQDRARFQRDLYWRKALYEKGVPVAEPLAALELAEKGIIIQEFLDGQTIEQLAARLSPDEKISLLQLVVKELARFQATATLSAPELHTLALTIDQTPALLERLIEKDQRRRPKGKQQGNPYHVIQAAVQAGEGTRKYAAHLDFLPRNVMVTAKGIQIVDLETLSIPSPDGTQGVFLGYDLATLLNWPEFTGGEMGRTGGEVWGETPGKTVEQELMAIFVHEFNSRVAGRPDLLANPADFYPRVQAMKLQTAYWIAGIEKQEAQKRFGRIEKLKAVVENLTRAEEQLGYCPGR